MTNRNNIVAVVDSILINGDLSSVFNCLWKAQEWPNFNPSIKSVEIFEEKDGYQYMRFFLTTENQTIGIETKRNAVFYESIDYIQTRPAPFFKEHRGRWEFKTENQSVRVILKHEVVLNVLKAKEFLNATSLNEVKKSVAKLLSSSGLRTMNAVKQAIERRNNDLVKEYDIWSYLS